MHTFFLFLLLGNLFFPAPLPQTQANVEINNVWAFYTFGEQVTFEATVTSLAPIQRIILFIEPDGQSIRNEEISFNIDGEITFQYDIRDKPLRSFAMTNFWFRVETTSQEIFDSPRYAFFYEDNRFNWQRLEDEFFQVNWYDGDLNFGQAIINTTRAGLAEAQKYLPVGLSAPLRIYVYSNAADLQSALQLSHLDWVAGHANPELNLILVSIQPGLEERIEMERQIPHEMMHILTYQVTGNSYPIQPVWLLEGLASLAELYPNSNYQLALENAVQSNELIPMTSLCSNFPAEASNAFLAYAQSASFVQFLHQNFGNSGLQNLLLQYRNGLGCEEGSSAALSVPLSHLENRWKQEALGMDAQWKAIENLIPYAGLLLFLLVPLFISLFFKQTKEALPGNIDSSVNAANNDA